MTNPYGNGTAIFTRDGDTARDFCDRINIGMVGVHVPIPVPLAYYTFGGWKASGFGALNQHGPDGFRFYTRTKPVPSRCPSGVQEDAEFSSQTMGWGSGAGRGGEIGRASYRESIGKGV